MSAKKKSSGWLKRLLLLSLVLVLLVGGVKLFSLYKRVYWPNVHLVGDSSALYIPSGATLEVVAGELEAKGYIRNRHSFEWVAERKNFTGSRIVPGKYLLADGMSNNELVDHLRAGNGRVDVEVTFNNIRTLPELAGRISSQLEPDSIALIGHFLNPEVWQKFGLNKETFITMFIPNTYAFNWATTPDQITERMAHEYRNFWTDERKAQAKKLGLSQSEVVTLASIVQAEQRVHPEEQPRIAGLYLNRLNRGMKLQSDPTVVHATGDFSINRVLREHLKTDSPYNTYLYAGLPPGPILLPDISAVEAVLNAEKHSFIFMCARDDFSGFHHFSTNLRQHNAYAQQYREALNQKKIYR